jgi:hypothetical protein
MLLPFNKKGTREMNNEPVVWTACLDCGKRVTGDSIHTCSPQLKTLTDEELGLTDVEISLIAEEFTGADSLDVVDFGRAILRKAQEK